MNILYTINGLRVNGMSSIVIQYIMGLSRFNDYHFTIFTDEIALQYMPILEKYKVEIIQSKMRKKNQIIYFSELIKTMNDKKFDVLHAHGNSATIAVELFAAKQCGIKKRIAHCHSTNCDHKVMDKILRPLFYHSYTQGIGCGEKAGKWLFGDHPHIVIKNAIDLEHYVFSQSERIIKREQLNIQDKFVIGHIGRFIDVKNHLYLLNVFREYTKEDNNVVLIMVGDGPLEKETKELAKQLEVDNKVIFYGITNDLAALYSVMDVLVLPSKYEGVPLTLIEAQANGLPCLISDKVSNEVIMTDLIQTEKLEQLNNWVNKIKKLKNYKRTTMISETAIKQLRSNGFEINDVVEQIDCIYRGKTT